MALKRTFHPEEISIYLSHVLKNAEQRIIATLENIGKNFVDSAKAMTAAEGGFNDVTGNLRSSIGYFLFAGEKLVSKYFYGNSAGEEAARSAIANIPRIIGYQLIGIAGMDYAQEVEAKGHNVITTQADFVLINLGTYLKNMAA